MFKQGKNSKTDLKLEVENDSTTDSIAVSKKTVSEKELSKGSINLSSAEKTTICENIIVEGIIQGAGNLVIEGG